MDKLMENAAWAYMPRIESIAEARRSELAEVKSKIRTKPQEVEDWFNKEIEKLGSIDLSGMLNKVR